MRCRGAGHGSVVAQRVDWCLIAGAKHSMSNSQSKHQNLSAGSMVALLCGNPRVEAVHPSFPCTPHLLWLQARLP